MKDPLIDKELIEALEANHEGLNLRGAAEVKYQAMLAAALENARDRACEAALHEIDSRFMFEANAAVHGLGGNDKSREADEVMKRVRQRYGAAELQSREKLHNAVKDFNDAVESMQEEDRITQRDKSTTSDSPPATAWAKSTMP